MLNGCVFVTGGAGFIGSAVVRDLIAETDARVVNIDKLTYAASFDAVADAARSPRYHFERVDICDGEALAGLFARYAPTAVMHLAAETHVDRSIDDPRQFIETNIVGTFTLLDAALAYWRTLDAKAREAFRFLNVSTDEVYGSLGAKGAFREDTPYQPSSPYSASKASADHLTRAWHRTYGLPVLITNCSNNFGPYQFPEKLIPLSIEKALTGQPLPIYGSGKNVRDWLFVTDHAAALRLVLARGRPGETYNIGARSERTNLEIARAICALMDELAPAPRPHGELITFVAERPGHDFRYAIDPAKIERELGWRPRQTFEDALAKTVAWYLAHHEWCERAREGGYRGDRLGLAPVSSAGAERR